MKTKIENILNEVLPKQAYRFVGVYNGAFGGRYIKIYFAAKDYDINQVRGQKPQAVSLNLDLVDLELTTQFFGGNGGHFIYRNPKLDDPKERFLAMKSVKVPFRKPKKEEKFVLAAVKRFAENWIKTLKENRNELRYQDIVNYDNLLN